MSADTSRLTQSDTTEDDMSNTYRSFWLFVVATCTLPLAADAQAADAQRSDFVGSWRLESWTQANGTPRCSEEEGGVSGQIIYSADGHMSAQLGCADTEVGDLGSLSGQAAAGRLSRRHLGYYGSFTLQPAAQTVTHHVQGSSSAGMVGTDQVRAFIFEAADRLVLSPDGGRSRLVWLRNR